MPTDSCPTFADANCRVLRKRWPLRLTAVLPGAFPACPAAKSRYHEHADKNYRRDDEPRVTQHGTDGSERPGDAQRQYQTATHHVQQDKTRNERQGFAPALGISRQGRCSLHVDQWPDRQQAAAGLDRHNSTLALLLQGKVKSGMPPIRRESSLTGSGCPLPVAQRQRRSESPRGHVPLSGGLSFPRDDQLAAV